MCNAILILLTVFNQHDLWLMVLTLITWLRQVFARFLNYKVTLPLTILCSLEANGEVQPSSTLAWGGKLSIIHWRERYLYNHWEVFCMRILPLLSIYYVIIMSLWIHGYLVYTSGDDLVLQNVFWCLYCSSCGHQMLFQVGICNPLT